MSTLQFYCINIVVDYQQSVSIRSFLMSIRLLCTSKRTKDHFTVILHWAVFLPSLGHKLKNPPARSHFMTPPGDYIVNLFRYHLSTHLVLLIPVSWVHVIVEGQHQDAWDKAHKQKRAYLKCQTKGLSVIHLPESHDSHRKSPCKRNTQCSY